MINNIKKNTVARMEKCIEAFKKKVNGIHVGRASPSLLDNIMVEYYGTLTPIRQLANITVEDTYTLKVSIFDVSTKSSVKKAIISSGICLNPSTVGVDILVYLPKLTEERCKNLIKIARIEAEKTKIALRNVRRDTNDQIKSLLKLKEISEDDERRSQDEIQKIINSLIREVDIALENKELELRKF